MTWQRLSVRTGAKAPDSLHEGVPLHLTSPIVYWLQGVFGYRTPPSMGGMQDGFMRKVAMAARVHLPSHLSRPADIQAHIVETCDRDSEVFLDVIDCVLEQTRGNGAELQKLLTLGGSAWRVSDAGRSLQRRVDAEAQAAASAVIAGGDAAAIEVASAWGAAFGRNPDPSDAWDHAIKAVEAVLIPTVVPTQAKPTLGHVVGQLRTQPEKWQFLLPGHDQQHGVSALQGLLDIIWPNPDRHSNANTRKPSAAEGEAVVHAAVLIVQWSRNPGFLQRLP